MALNLRKCIVVVLILHTFLMCSCTSLPENNPIPQYFVPYSLECEVGNHASASEPIPLVISLRNISERSEGCDILHFEDHLSLELMLYDNKRVVPIGSAQTGIVGGRRSTESGYIVSELPTWILPGERATYTFDLAKRFHISDQGHYLLIARYRYRRTGDDMVIGGSAAFSIGRVIDDPVRWKYPGDPNGVISDGGVK
jgi:hypothetical protein